MWEIGFTARKSCVAPGTRNSNHYRKDNDGGVTESIVRNISKVNHFSPLAMGLSSQYAGRQMASSPTKRLRLLAAILLAATTALLGVILKEKLAPASYDWLHSLANRKAFDDSRVVIVYLDLASYLHLHEDPAERWPRELHAKLLDRLSKEGAKAVVFDVVFDSPSGHPEADKSLADALSKNEHSILAAEYNTKITHEASMDTAWTAAHKLLLPNELFLKSATAWGVASLWVDDDLEVRRLFPGFDETRKSLSWATAAQLGLATNLTVSGREGRMWMRYYGPALTVPHVSFSEALDRAGLPENFFRDKIVFVGARPMEGLIDAGRDEFRNPFHSRDYKEFFMPGVEVHATQMLNLLRGDWLRRLADSSENLALFAVALLFSGLIWLRPIPATLAAIAGCGFVLALAVVMFSKNIWLPWLAIVSVQAPTALFGSWLWQFQDWFFTRRKLEAAQRAADAKIREQAALIDKAHDAIIVQDLSGNILYANPSAEKLYGWNFSESGVSTAVELFSPDSAAAETARAATLKQGEWNGELRQQTKNGQIVTVASRWTLIQRDHAQPGALLLINSDITEKKSLEQQFLRTQRMNTIGTLAGGMAHDLNNALSPVLLGTNLLRRKISDPEDQKLLSLMETSTNRGADMVRQVLLFARGQGGDFERLELGALVKDMEKMVRETFPKNITLNTFVPSDLWPVQGNLTQIHQVLLNLCVNARDAMPQGGTLSFVADNVELSSSEAQEISEGRMGRFVSLLVADTGTGMAPEVKAKIFEPFFTTKGEGKGTGIGLATVMRILKSHNGFLRVESEPGQGSSFEIFLPCAPDAPSVIEAQQDEALPRGHGELILLADDERALCELVASELREFGYKVLIAANGAEAVELFRDHQNEVRLLIMDHSMPAMSGLYAISEIRKIRADLPVIIASGEPGEKKLERSTELSKPFALAELLAAVNRSLK